mgnify:CR=1 FL=1
MKKSLNLFKGQRQYKESRKPYRSRPIRKIGTVPKQTSKERYYKDKAIKAVAKVGEEDSNSGKTFHIWTE